GDWSGARIFSVGGSSGISISGTELLPNRSSLVTSSGVKMLSCSSTRRAVKVIASGSAVCSGSGDAAGVDAGESASTTFWHKGHCTRWPRSALRTAISFRHALQWIFTVSINDPILGRARTVPFRNCKARRGANSTGKLDPDGRLHTGLEVVGGVAPTDSDLQCAAAGD